MQNMVRRESGDRHSHHVTADGRQRETGLQHSPIEAFGQQQRQDQADDGPEGGHDDEDDDIDGHAAGDQCDQ